MSTSSSPLVVLTFDDAVSNHATFVAPLLRRYGFGATFYVCEFAGEGTDLFETDKRQYMTWEQIRTLDRMGFEVGNHTGHHSVLKELSETETLTEIEWIEKRCAEYDIPTPTTFSYPVGIEDPRALPILMEKGYRWGRLCGDRAYVPGSDHPLLVPSFVIRGNDLAPFCAALRHAADDKVVVFTFHGVPDYNHPWVDTPPEVFERYLEILAEKNCRVIALRDLSVAGANRA